MSLTDKMRTAMTNNGMTQRDVAKKLGVSKAVVSARFLHCRSLKILLETMEACDCDVVLRQKNGECEMIITLDDIRMIWRKIYKKSSWSKKHLTTVLVML